MLGFIKTTPRVDFDKGIVLPSREKEPRVTKAEIAALLAMLALVALAFAARVYFLMPRMP